MQITHEEAWWLIQFSADEALSPQESSVLSTHMKACLTCRAYAAEIKEVEDALLPLMKRQWDFRPIPLSIKVLRKRGANSSMSDILAMRTALISFVFVALVFSAWQLTRSAQQLPGLSPMIVSPIPTPSIESTKTMTSSESCDVTPFNVQPKDTLESIAYQFSISKDEIISINHLKTETVSTGMTLMIPVCNFTPTGTVWPATTTFTPVMSSATSSPEPNRD